jgi:hypothetical protein
VKQYVQFNLETAVDRLPHGAKLMFIDVCPFLGLHHGGEHATHPIAHFSGRLTLLLLLAWGGGHAAPSRLASRPEKRTLGRVQLLFLG